MIVCRDRDEIQVTFTLLGVQPQDMKVHNDLSDTEMRDKLDEKLADPEIYESSRAGDRAVWQKKHAECMDALDRAEELWMKALEKLEVAEAQ